MSAIIPFYKPQDIFISGASGCTLTDDTGKKYLDFEAGVWCANLGHGREEILKCIADQALRCQHHGYAFRNQASEELSVALNDITGLRGGSSVFLSSGSEAVNLAITIARKLTGRKKVVLIAHSYLSAYGYGMNVDENTEILRIHEEDAAMSPNPDFSDAAAFVAEVGGASMGVVRFPGRNFLRNICKVAKECGSLVIADEVTTGFGRHGYWFGYQHYGILPDMVVCGKALGNGYPVSSLTVSNNLSGLFSTSPFRYAQSHQNDPPGCCAGLEVIAIIQRDDILKKVISIGEYLHCGLKMIVQAHPDKVREIRSRGLMAALELQECCNGEEIHKRMFHLGLITGFRDNTFRFMPPLIVSRGQIDQLLECLNQILSGEP